MTLSRESRVGTGAELFFFQSELLTVPVFLTKPVFLKRGGGNLITTKNKKTLSESFKISTKVWCESQNC